MTNKNSTKRALFASAMALLLCFTMLLGTTYAWFTDSVVSENNIIVAGNLDVKFYWSTDASNWDEVDENTNVFTNTKWEPGHTEVVYLKVENAGSLALKYQLGLNVVSEIAGINVDENPFKLSNYIQFDVIETETAFADRDAARAAVKDAKLVANSYSKAATLENKDDFDVVALVVYMPEAVGNEANYKTGTAEPTVNLGLSVFATQLAYESDSFDNQYDANAAFSVWDGTVPAELPASLVVDPATRTITVNDAKAFAYLNTLDDVWASLYTNGQGTDYSNYAPQNGGKGTDYYYHWDWTVKLNCDIDLANIAWTPVDLSFFKAFDGQGKTIKNISIETSSTGEVGLFSHIKGGVSNLTVENISVNATNGISVGAVAGTSHGNISNVTVKGAIVTGSKYVGGIIGYGYANVINSAVYDSVITIPAGGQKEAGGLAGYLCDKTEVNGNTVKDTVISAPTVASALVSQPNGNFVISFNTVENVIVTTSDDTADIFVSNNVGGKSIVANNTEIGCTVKSSAVTTLVDDANELKTAIASGADVIYAEGVVVEGTTMLNSGATIIGATFKNENGIAVRETVSGTFKDCTFEGSEALRWCYSTAGDTVVFENCVIKTDFRGVHFDGMHGDVIFRNCEINGFNAIGGNGTVTFEKCTFGNDASSYNGLNMYSNINLIDCTFNYVSGKTNFIDMEGTGKTLTITNCKAFLDGAETDIANFVGGSKLAQNTVVIK